MLKLLIIMVGGLLVGYVLLLIVDRVGIIRIAYNTLNLFSFLNIKTGWMKWLRRQRPDFIIHEGERFYLDKNDSLFITKGEFEKREKKWLRANLKPDWVVVDVGANVGYHTVLFANLCKYVYAFEPAEETYDLLKTNCQLHSNIYFYKYALSNKTGVTKLFRNPTCSGDHSLIESSERTEYESIHLRQLDFLINEKIDFVKIDVQGGECEVLEGGLEIIKKHKPILMVEFEGDITRLKKMIEDLGYDIFSIDRYGKLIKFRNKKLQNVICI